MSGNSWANLGQDCIKCRLNVYPHKQVIDMAGTSQFCTNRLYFINVFIHERIILFRILSSIACGPNNAVLLA